MEWARLRLAEVIDIGGLAMIAAMSERTFQRRFREAVGLTPKLWLQRERMFRAQELLETSGSPLSEIAELCGYKSLETFRVAFRRSLGTSPAAYRARFRRAV